MKQLIALLAATMLAACSDGGSDGGGESGSGASHVLAISWQPSFCETAPRKPECRSQTGERFDARHFALHGLWPQPGTNVYCGIGEEEIETDKAGRWNDLDTPRIGEEIWQELRRVMPGTRSGLHRHEWIKHGTCHGDGSIDAYYRDSLKLMDWVNKSSIRYLFEASIGRRLTGKDIRDAFERDFGRGTGDRLRISCRKDEDSGRLLIVEITIGLSGDIAGATSLGPLLEAAPATDPGCPAGIVDPAGFQ